MSSPFPLFRAFPSVVAAERSATDGPYVAPSQRYTYDMSPALHRGASRCNSRRACDALMLREEFLRDSEQRNTKLVDKNKRICGQTNNFDRQTNKNIHAQTNWRLTTSSTAAPNANPVPLSPAQTGAPPLRREFQPRLGSRSEASGVGANLLHRTIRTLNTITRTLNSIIRTLK